MKPLCGLRVLSGEIKEIAHLQKAADGLRINEEKRTSAQGISAQVACARVFF